MAKLKPEILRERREHILNAAEQCFARAGFHRTTMQDICREASVSPGALYIYFDSKEALIAGIAERDRAEFGERLAKLAAAPDFMTALGEVGRQFFVEDPPHRRKLCVEIGLEATRNERVGEIYCAMDMFVKESFVALFQRLKDEGRIAPVIDIPTLAQAFLTIGDGLFWRRAVDAEFEAETVLPALIGAIGALLRPCTPETMAAAPEARGENSANKATP